MAKQPTPVRDRLLLICATLLNGIRTELPKPVRPFIPVALAKMDSLTEPQAIEMARTICEFADGVRPLLPESQ